MSLRRVAARFWARTKETERGCWEWQGPRNRRGYGQVSIWGFKTKAHRIAWELANFAPIPDGLCVLHRCDNPPCVNPEHLLIGTHAENMADMRAKGRAFVLRNPERVPRGDRHYKRLRPETVVRGEAHPMATLIDDDIRAIREVHADDISLATIARFWFISTTQASRIVNGQRWSHVQ